MLDETTPAAQDPAGETSGTAPAEGGGGSADWFEAVPEAFRSHEAVARLRGKPIADLVAAYVAASEYVKAGDGKIVKAEEVASDPLAAMRKLGAPETPDGYRIELPQDVPQGALDEASVGWFKEAAAAAGLLPPQAERLFTAYVERIKAMTQEAERAIEQARAALKSEWGSNYDANLRKASEAAEALGLKEKLTSAGLGADPDVIKALARVHPLLRGREAGPVTSAPAPQKDEKYGMQLILEAYRAHNSGDEYMAALKLQEARKYFGVKQ